MTASEARPEAPGRRGAGLRLFMLDNYDSFTYNLVQYLSEFGAEVAVARNDAVTPSEVAAGGYHGVVISPGPGVPADAGVSEAVIRAVTGRTPLLGVCLGHQALGEVFGARVVRAERLMHGKTSPVLHDGRDLFAGLENPFTATRYHSLLLERGSVNGVLEISAWTEEGEVMAIRHREAPAWGVQFHPESILTGAGKHLLANYLDACRAAAGGEAPGDPRTPAGMTGDSRGLGAALERLADGGNLSRGEMRAAMDVVMRGEATAAQIGALLMALRVRGETPEEIAGAAESMRTHARRIAVAREPLLDTCGTGGDRSGTFNISTASAFVAAGAGVAVAKHGNRSVSSRCGSADVLEALGARIDLPPEAVAASIESVGFGFLFAPVHHGAMKHAAAPRRELALRTLFNVLGPLSNPAGATHQVLGVYAAGLTSTLAEVLRILGLRGAMVVHGAGGLDELSLAGPSRVSELRDGTVRTYEVAPAELGLASAPADALAGGGAAENALLIRAVFTGREGPARDVVCLNAGAALYTVGASATLAGGVRLARDTVESGRALQAVENYVRFTREWDG